MHMRVVAIALLVAALSLSGCLGIDNMAEFKATLGFHPPAPLPLPPPLAPLARARASLTLASVEQPIAFSAQGSSDPQGLPLTFTWEFGDGELASTSEATHAYRSAGIYRATLTALSKAGLRADDSVTITITQNRAPTAAMAVLRNGQAADRALAGEELDFQAIAADPEGLPVTLRWDFGDGSTALTQDARHAYAKGGRYTVALSAEDPAGLSAAASRDLAIDQVLSAQGQVGGLMGDVRAHALDVGAEAQRVRATLAFDPSLGLNALRLVLADVQGREVAKASGQPAPGTQGTVQVALEVPASALAGHAPGAWSLRVERLSGIQVDYQLTAEASY